MAYFLNRSQISQVIIWAAFGNPGNAKQVRAYMKEHFGVAYCVEAVRALLRKHGLRVIRPKAIPGNPPGIGEQKQFVGKYHETETSGEPGSVVLFGDGMRLIRRNVPGLCRGAPDYPLIPETNTGRRRSDILDAYNPETRSFRHLAGEGNRNADRTIGFSDVIHKTYPYAPQITIISDNARYFHAKIVTEWLEKNGKISI